MRRARKLWVVLALALGAFGLLGAPAGAAADRPDHLVTIKKFAYYPNTLEVRPGATIAVRNIDGQRHGIPHSLTAFNGSFDTGVFTTGFRVVTAPSERGVYQFLCTVHPDFMFGKIRVSNTA